MSKRLTLRPWLTVAEAASYLSVAFDEPFSDADVLRLALDAQVDLSVNFVNHARACIGRVVTVAEAGEREIVRQGPRGERRTTDVNGIRLSGDRVFQYTTDKVVSVEGVWDLPMVGGERFHVETAWQALTGGSEVKRLAIDGCFVTQGEGWCQLMEPFDEDAPQPQWHPSQRLPTDARLVVRSRAITTLIERVSGNPSPAKAIERELGNRERATLLTIIAALAQEGKVSINEPWKAAEVIEAMVKRIGADVGVSTIYELLKAIPDAVERKSK